MFKLLFIVTYLFFNIQICHSCMRMIIGGGGDVTVPPRVTTTLAPTTIAPLVCSTCSQATIIRGSGVGMDQPITQMQGINANGCRTIAVTCTSNIAGTQVNFFWYDNGADRGTSTGTTTITRNLVCNANGDLILTENGVSAVVDQVECISAPVAPVCSTCAAQVAVITNSGIGKDEPIMQVAGTDANGCRTVAVTCTADTPGKEIFYFWKQAGADRGSSSAITTITRNLVCNENAQFVLTEPDTMAMGIVDQVECISATVAPVCSTCAAQVTVITNSGIGKDEPIMQVAGTDANGCRTVAVTCTADTPGKEIFYFWKQAGADRGTSSATTTITRNLVCNENAQFVLTEPDTMAMGIVDQVECISATVAPVCSTCAAQVAVITFSGIGKDEPIMQVAGTDANGCRTVDVTCTAQTVGTNIIVNWKQAGADRGTSTGTTAVTRNLVCNENAQFVLNDPMGIVDQVECTSPICETCTEIEVIMDSGIGVNQPITQMIGKNANGCNTVTVTCTTPNVGEDIYYFWDRGTSSGVTTVTRVLTCNSDGELELTEGTDTGVVTQVECVTAG